MLKSKQLIYVPLCIMNVFDSLLNHHQVKNQMDKNAGEKKTFKVVLMESENQVYI